MVGDCCAPTLNSTVLALDGHLEVDAIGILDVFFEFVLRLVRRDNPGLLLAAASHEEHSGEETKTQGRQDESPR
jgi:hypothetical protein